VIHMNRKEYKGNKRWSLLELYQLVGLLAFDPKPHVTFSDFLTVGILFPEKNLTKHNK